MSFAEKIYITESCPRDGWQNHPQFIPTELKIGLIKKMLDCGVKSMEVTSFVNPKAVPQMADAAEVVAGVRDYAAQKGVDLLALALNKRGVDSARAAGLKNITFVVSASEEHNRRNANRSIEDSLEEFRKMAAEAEGLNIQLALPCVFGSPFGDEIPLERIARLCEEGLKAGAREIGLADTAGLSAPRHTREVLRHVKSYLEPAKISLHLHDTYGMGLANAYVALEEGVHRLDSSLGAMGGCPFVRGAKGNIATEDLLHLIRECGLGTDYDPEKALAVSLEMAAALNLEVASSLGRVARNKACREQQ